MAIVVSCERCSQELDTPGAVLISPPYTIGSIEHVQKMHLCVRCFRIVHDLIDRGEV